MYSTDASNYRQVPIGLVVPRDEDDVVATLRIARDHGAPILARGGGTSLAGQCCNVAVVIDTSKYMNRILELDPVRRIARVEPGVVLDRLRDAAEVHGLTFGPDPATHSRCTLGGMIGNNSCGVHSIMSGKTDANIESMRVLTADGVEMVVGPTSEDDLASIIAAGGRRGQIYSELRSIRDRYGDLIRKKFPPIPRNVSGFNLEQLLPEHGFNVARSLVGTEGTCVFVLEAAARLVPSPPYRSLVVLGFDDVYVAADMVPAVMKGAPIGLEGIDDNLIRDMRKKNLYPEAADLLPEGRGWLLVEHGADSSEELGERVAEFVAMMQRKRKNRPSIRIFDDPQLARLVWKTRESALGATAVVPGQPHAWEGWEDAAVRPDRLGSYLRELRSLMNEYGYRSNLYGHFGDGCVHTRINFDLESNEGIAFFREFVERAAHLVVRHGGSLSGEHGDGQARAELLPIMFGDELIEAFREFKRAWDPEGRMNPGKVVDPYPIDSNLRLGAQWQPMRTDTAFAYEQDEGSFTNAMIRCVGVGECRRTEGGTMCPSYMVTREEKHSTRGRARLLFEMIDGSVLDRGWKSDEVREALDLCLSCKACKSECPVGVDMATYKSEFLHHYYKGRARPRAAYTMGLIPEWARLGSRYPGLTNAMTSLAGSFGKRLAGISQGRELPRFAPKSLQRMHRAREPRVSDGKRVILWADTFTDCFNPEIGSSAIASLEALGFRVDLSPEGLCCGRPFYDFGFLHFAKKKLANILDRLEPEIDARTPIVGLEPGCTSVFRDELLNLFPDDPRAKALSTQFITFQELVRQPLLSAELPSMAPVDAIVQSHCHRKALSTSTVDDDVLTSIGVRRLNGDIGCCGMAGAFGFEAHKFDVSVAIANRELLPAIRSAPREAIVVADGFSCREQVRQLSGSKPFHTAQLVEQALTGRVSDRDDQPASQARRAGVIVAVAAGLFAVWLIRRKRRRGRKRS